MGIATALLLVGALGIMIAMHSVGHGGHGASHGPHEEPANNGGTSSPGSPTGKESDRGKHGCC
jgi:hypothetical protein